MDPEKVEKLNELKILKDLFNAVTEDDILISKGNELYYRGKKIPDKIKTQLLVDAQMIKSMDLWNILLDCMKFEANKQLYATSKTPDDMIFGKAMLLTLDIMEKKIDNLSRIK